MVYDPVHPSLEDAEFPPAAVQHLLVETWYHKHNQVYDKKDRLRQHLMYFTEG
jgi:hypothetical protein